MSEIRRTPSQPIHISRWRIATLICLILLALAAASGMSLLEQSKAQISYLQSKLKTAPQIKYLAVLLDTKQLPAQLISFDPSDGFVQIQRLNNVKEGPDDSLQLWALDARGQAHSVGVISSSIKTAQLASTQAQLAQTVTLAVSVESKGGVAAGQQPRLPYLFSGALIKKAL